MKQNKSVQIIFLSLILSCFFLSGEVFAYKKSDLKKYKNTKKCIKCDLTDLNLSGSNLSGANLSGSNLGGANLSGANLSEANLKEVNLTGANLSEIIIDEKAFSTLDVSEHTFMNKSTLAEETKKKKEQELRKKKEQELQKKAVEGFNDFKFGMTWNQIKATGVCKNWAFIFGGVGTECYKVAGEKRYFYFSFEHWQKNTDGSYAAQNLRRIRVGLGKFMPSYYKKLASDFGKKYKEKYRLTIEQSIGLNKGNLITFFEDARVTLVQKDNGINLYYTKAEHPTYKIYSPKDISSDEF